MDKFAIFLYQILLDNRQGRYVNCPFIVFPTTSGVVRLLLFCF